MKKLFLLIFLNYFFFSAVVYAGNIDSPAISSVRLRSVVVENSPGFNYLRFLIEGKKAGYFEGILDIEKSAQKSLEYFFTGLAMPDKDLWVNLSPDEPSRVIDFRLSNTDMGRIMLMADLRLKEDMAELMNPEISPTGREFWKRVYEKSRQLGAVDKIPFLTRLWIVPEKAEVCRSPGGVSILKSQLKVKLEPVYLSSNAGAKDKSPRELEDFAASVISELILPVLNQRVSESYSYADLREVYNALILAKWYKQRFSSQSDGFLKGLNPDILKDQELDFFYSPQEIYQDYLESFKDKTYSFSESNADGPWCKIVTTKHYFSGGVDFSGMKIREVGNETEIQPDKDRFYFTSELLIPQGIQKPLQYAKSHLEVTREDSSLVVHTYLTLAKKLTAIEPMLFIKHRTLDLDSRERIDRILISKL